MKVLCWTVLLSLGFCGLLFSHPPVDIETKVSGTQIDITVNHPVGDPNTHYIDKIEVFLNGIKVSEQSFKQQDGNFQKTTVTVPSLKKGDAVEVSANCNRFGNLRKSTAV